MLRKKGVRVVSITEHGEDTPTGKLMEAIIESVDEFYSENLHPEVRTFLDETGNPVLNKPFKRVDLRQQLQRVAKL